MPKPPLSPQRIYAGAGATILILMVTIFLSFQRFDDLQNANAWNEHSYQVLLESGHLNRSLTAIQTGARGFLRTGDEWYLGPYKSRRPDFEDHYRNLVRLTQDNPEQQKRLQLLHGHYSTWLAKHIQPLIIMRRRTADTQTAVRRAAPQARARKELMDAMRDNIASIETAEAQLLQQRSTTENRMLLLARSTLLINGAIAIVLALGQAMQLAAGTRRLESANEHMTKQVDQVAKTERAAEVVHQHNEMILQAADEGIAGLNQSGRITFFNPAAEAITGYSAAEAIGKNHHDLLHSKRRDGSPYPLDKCLVHQTLQDGTVHKAVNEVFWRKDGSTVPVDFTSAPLVVRSETDEDEEGKQVGAVIIFRDITSRQESDRVMRELGSIVENADDAIMAFTLDGRINRWNKAATETYGFSEADIVGRYVQVMMPPELPDEMPSLLDKIRNRQPVERYETQRLRKDGTPIEVVLSLSPILDENGNVTGASSISREVYRSRQKRLQAANTANSQPAETQNTAKTNTHF